MKLRLEDFKWAQRRFPSTEFKRIWTVGLAQYFLSRADIPVSQPFLLSLVHQLIEFKSFDLVLTIFKNDRLGAGLSVEGYLLAFQPLQALIDSGNPSAIRFLLKLFSEENSALTLARLPFLDQDSIWPRVVRSRFGFIDLVTDLSSPRYWSSVSDSAKWNNILRLGITEISESRPIISDEIQTLLQSQTSEYLEDQTWKMLLDVVAHRRLGIFMGDTHNFSDPTRRAMKKNYPEGLIPSTVKPDRALEQRPSLQRNPTFMAPRKGKVYTPKIPRRDVRTNALPKGFRSSSFARPLSVGSIRI